MRTAWTRVLIIAALCLALAPAALAGDEASPWTDTKQLEQHLESACDVVESICGAKFEKRPDVRVSDADTVAKLLLTDFAALPEEMLEKADHRRLARLMAPFLLAKYDTEGNVIHVQPEAAKRVQAVQKEEEALGLDHMRLLLVHEATHALDFPRFDWMVERRARKTIDEHQALNAVVEGHAQWVTEQAAARWNLESAFSRLTDAILGKPDAVSAAEKPVAAAVLAQLHFAYAEGHAFFTAVAEARGAEGVDAVLRTPPRRSRLIEQPATYLEPEPEPVRDVKAIVEAFRPLVGAEAWKVQTQRPLEAALRSQAARVPAERRDEFLRGFVDAHVLVGTVRGEDLQVVAVAMLFDAPENARLFVDLERLMVESAKSTPAVTFDTKVLADGAGTGDKLSGFHMHRVIKVGGTEVGVRQQVFVVGRVVCEISAINVRGMDRAAVDPAVDYAAAILADPEARKTLRKPDAFPFRSTKRTITVRVVGPDGEPVPQATVTAMTGTESHLRFAHASCFDGVCKLTLGLEPAQLIATLARDAKGEALNFGPSAPVPIETDDREAELRMTAGLKISGRVLTETGEPAAGAQIQAQPSRGIPRQFLSGDTHGMARAAADGTFEIVGLADTTYRLVVTAGDDPHGLESPFPGQKAGSIGVELKLPKLDTIEITVVDANAMPIPRASVSAQPRGGGSYRSISTNEEGIARLRGIDRDKTYALMVDVEHVPERDDLSNYSKPGWKPTDTRVELAPGWTLRGVVRGDDGKPVAARVFRRTGKGGWSARDTAPDGSYVMRGLAGPVEVAARPRGAEFDRLLQKTLDWTKIEPTNDPVDLLLAEVDDARILRIKILDPEGRPVPTVKLTVGTGAEENSFGTSSTRDVRDGEVTLERPTTPYAIAVFRARGRDGSALALGPVLRHGIDPTEGRLEFRLQAGRTLAGVVESAEGKPVAGVKVQALPAMAGSLSRSEWEAHGVAETGADGRFVLTSLGEEPYALRAVPPKPHVEPEPVRVGPTDTEARIRLGASIVVAVLDWQDRPVAGARVQVIRVTPQAGGETTWTYPVDGPTGADGSIPMRSFVSATKHRLKVTPPKDRGDLLSQHLLDWDGTATTVRLRRGFAITGVVRDAQGPVGNAGVMRRAPWAEDPDAWEWLAETTTEGRFVTRTVPWGPIELRAERNRVDAQADPHVSDVVQVVPDHPKATLVIEPRTAVLRLRLKQAQKGWSGWVVREGGGRTAFEFEQDRTIEITGLADGTYSVYLPHPEDDARCVYATGIASSKGETKLELIATRSLAFRVVLPEGATGLTAYVDGPAGERFDATKSADGVYSAQGLPPGTWTVYAYAKVGETWYEGTAKLDGSAPPTLTLKPLEED